MNPPASQKIPICLITGFLGSGKTSLLKHLLARHQGRRLACLVNEFSPDDIDAQWLARDHARVTAIPGGSIFCRCLVTEFISQLERIREMREPVEGVVIEASGMANPEVIDRMLAETRLNTFFEVVHVVSLVDPGTFDRLRQTLPNIVAQIRASDTVLLNKTDLHSQSRVEQTESSLRELNPRLTIVRTEYARADICLFDAARKPQTDAGDYAACRDPNYLPVTVALPDEVDLAALEKAIVSLSPQLYRAKGYAASRGRVWYVDHVAGRTTTTACSHAGPMRLVCILSGDASADKVAQAMRPLGGQVARGPTGPIISLEG